MKINRINIQGIGGIKDISINFNDGLNLICGPNGIGKTTILECLAQSFSVRSSNILKRNVDVEVGKWNIQVEEKEILQNKEFFRHSYNPTDSIEGGNALHEFLNKVIVFKTYRTFSYVGIVSITRDPQRNIGDVSEIINNGVSAQDIKAWFMNRYMWSKHDDVITEEQRHNFELATKIFNMIDKDIEFLNIKGDTFDIILKTPNGNIYFEYLSSGYKSNIYVILGLIKEIEFRFKSPCIKIEDFDGVILIDEIDLHLHPQWQAVLIKILKELLPRAQIIATTHSPSMIQVAESNEIIALGFNEFKQVHVRELSSSKFGYQGWTFEEILTDVMGLEQTRTDIYNEAMKNFETALDNEDFYAANSAFYTLDSMLHPSNPLRKILKIQLAALGGDE